MSVSGKQRNFQKKFFIQAFQEQLRDFSISSIC